MLKGVVIGAGYFSRFHLEAWQRLTEVQIVAVCDRDLARAEASAKAFGVPAWHDDYEALIDRERPDFVDIVTPPPTHLPICRYAAARGAAVICQKPLAPSFDEAKQLVDAMEAAGARFMVHENWRWQPWYRTIHQIQQRGDIGAFTHLLFCMRTGDGWGDDAYLARQPYFRDYPRLLIFETGVHLLDTFRFLLGEVETVYAHLRRLNPAIRGEDAGQVHLTFTSGATASLDANRYNETEASNPRFTFGRLRIDATAGHLEMDEASRIRIKPLGRPAGEHPYPRQDRNFAGDCCYLLQQHFVACMQQGEPFESEGRDYLRTLELVEACYASANERRVVHLPGHPAPSP